MTEKTVDIYEDPNVIADMIDRYTNAEDSDEARADVVAELAKELGKPARSIISKLVREGVYVAKTRKTKDGQVVRTKAALVDDLLRILNVEMTESEASSLEKATKLALQKLIKAVTPNDSTQGNPA